jgi:TrmH family RNA methyltransferase
MPRVTSRQHVVVKRLRQLARHSRVANDGAILLDGEHLVAEAIAAGLPIEVAVFRDPPAPGARDASTSLADAVVGAGGRVLTASEQAFGAMSPVQHPSGVVAIGRARTVSIADLFVQREAKRTPFVPLLIGVQDPGNVGAVIRSAAALGATGVAAIEGSADPFGWKALRGAMGGTFRLPVASAGTIDDIIAARDRTGIRLLATVPRGGTPLPEADLRGPTAILFGGEGAGLPDAATDAADGAISIPMRASVESLNVATAAALVLYEAARQRVNWE